MSAAWRVRSLPLDGYVRVSKVGGRSGERFLSPRLQEDAIRGYAAARELPVGRVFFELNRSGTATKRPELVAALSRISAGVSGGLIVARLDRLGRSAAGTLRVLEQIEQAEGRFVSVEDGFDSSTPVGKAMSTILLALAELELGRLAAHSLAARKRSIQRGIHLASVTVPGYRRDENGRLEPDSRDGPLIAEAFRRRAAGETYTELAEFLRRGAVGGPAALPYWTARKVYRLFQNPVYLGEAYSGHERNLSAHPPLIGRALWLAAQAASSSARANRHGRTLLAGLIRCGGCCHVLSHSRDARTGCGREYSCRRHFSSGDCQAPVDASAAALERAVVEIFFSRLEAERPNADIAAELDIAERMLASLEAQVEPRRYWRSAFIDSDNVGLETARAHVLALWRQTQLAALPAAATLRRGWPRMPLAEQRRILSLALEAVVLVGGKEPLESRLELVFAGGPRNWFPRMGVKQPLEPFAPGPMA